MTPRIVLFGATGYTGRLLAERLAGQGERPLLAGRSPERLAALSVALDGLEWRVADVERAASVQSLVGPGDVLVSTVGPFMKWGEPAVRAVIAAGATYLDSTGEPAFIRRVFEAHGPQAARAGATLLPAMGYDFVPGALAGALVLRDAGPAAVRVDVGYYVLGAGAGALSRGTRASLAGAALGPGFAFRDGRLRAARPAERVRAFDGRAAVSVGGAEHFGLPAAHPGLREVNVYLGWFGPLARPVQVLTRLGTAAGRVPGVTALLRAGGERLAGLGALPEPGTTSAARSWVAAAAYDRAGAQLAELRLAGPDPYDLTAGLLAWAARRALLERLAARGAVGPLTAFGLDALEQGCAEAGLERTAE